MAYQTLNRLKWTGRLDGCEVVILHRGAPDNRRVIRGRDISAVKKSCFYYIENDREMVMPLHRILEIRSEGKMLWKRSTAKG